MAADNAIIIGMIAANFAPKHRNQIIMWGLFGALVFRIIFAFFASSSLYSLYSLCKVFSAFYVSCFN